MPKYVEIKDKEGQTAGYVMDYEDGYQVVHDKNGQPSSYIYDQEKLNAALHESVEEDNCHSGGGWPSIKENGLFCCIMIYGYRIARYLFPIIFLFSPASFIPAFLCYLFMWPLEIWWQHVFFNFPPSGCWEISSCIGVISVTLQILLVLFCNFF